VTGVDAALAHVREIARRTPGVMYR
jgi:hypothetical protein